LAFSSDGLSAPRRLSTNKVCSNCVVWPPIGSALPLDPPHHLVESGRDHAVREVHADVQVLVAAHEVSPQYGTTG
jgi:hypothetical protein